MKNLLLFFATILTINCYAQISFEKGYYIDNSDQKKECFIKNDDWADSPIDFKYKVSENDDVKTIAIDSVKEFAIYNISKYVRKTVKIDQSSEDIDELSTDKNPVFNEKQLFLKVLIEGKANLYEAGNSKKYFYNVDSSNIQQLIFKSYLAYNNSLISEGKPDYNIKVNNQFRQQLWENLKCSSISMDDLMKLDYKKTSLINVFIEYNKCSSSDFINYEGKQQRDSFNLTLRPHLNSSSLSLTQSPLVNYEDTDFGNKIGFGFGIEAEFIFPFNKNKWSLLIEPTYQSFKEEKTFEHKFILTGTVEAEVKYTSIEIPLGIRHYFFLNNNSKIFINASFVYDFNLNSKIDFKNSDNSIVKSLDFEHAINFAFGIGYKLYNKYVLEIRYNTSRDNLASYSTWSSDYKTTSIIFGYSIF